MQKPTGIPLILGHQHVVVPTTPEQPEPGKDREVNPNKIPLHAELQFGHTDVCLDFSCVRGHYGHFDTHQSEMTDSRAMVRYLRCSVCEDTYRLGAMIQLLRLSSKEVSLYRRSQTDHDFPRQVVPPGKEREVNPNADSLRADLQWKGTCALLDFTCECGLSGRAGDYFMNHVGCVYCGAVYRCNNRLQAILLSSNEATQLLQQGITPLISEDDD